MKITRRRLSQLIREELAGSRAAPGGIWSVGPEADIVGGAKGEQKVNIRAAAISAVIKKLEGLDTSNLQKGNVIDKSDLNALSKELKKYDIRPVNIDASIGQDATKQRSYLITGPSAPGASAGGALKALKAMIKEEE